MKLTALPKLEINDFSIKGIAGWFMAYIIKGHEPVPLFRCPKCERHLDFKAYAIAPMVIQGKGYGKVEPDFKCKCNRFNEPVALASWPDEYRKRAGQMEVESLKQKQATQGVPEFKNP